MMGLHRYSLERLLRSPLILCCCLNDGRGIKAKSVRYDVYLCGGISKYGLLAV